MWPFTKKNTSTPSASPLARIIEWANDHKLPELRPYDSLFYKECGVPRDVRRLQNLRFLVVTDNHGITELPPELALLPTLQGIWIDHNRVRSIPTALYQCQSLRHLDLEGNDITRVEDGIHAMRNVVGVDLSGNKLVHVSPDVAKMASLNNLDISNQKHGVDLMYDGNTPLSEVSVSALFRLDERINVRH